VYWQAEQRGARIVEGADTGDWRTEPTDLASRVWIPIMARDQVPQTRRIDLCRTRLATPVTALVVNPERTMEFATREWVDWFKHRRLLEPIGGVPQRSWRRRTTHNRKGPPWWPDSSKCISGKTVAVPGLRRECQLRAGEGWATHSESGRLWTGGISLPIV